MALLEEIEAAATEYLGVIEFGNDITPQERAEIIGSMKEDYFAGASQLAQFILRDIAAGKSLEEIETLLLELDDLSEE